MLRPSAMETCAELPIPAPAVPEPDARPDEAILRITQLTAGYGQRTVIDDLSLSLQAGEIVALLGVNGAGKSTLLKALIGLVPTSSGSVYFGSRNIVGWPPHQRARSGLAYLMQGGAVFPGLSVLANLEAATADLDPDARKLGIEDVLRLFGGLVEAVDRRAGLLSGGQRQMLALAMIFARRPRVLLLDEPSAGLSPRLMEAVLEKITVACRSWNASVLLVEQNVRAALNIAHRAAVMDRGRLTLETSDPRAWLSGGHLDRLLWGEVEGASIDRPRT